MENLLNSILSTAQVFTSAYIVSMEIPLNYNTIQWTRSALCRIMADVIQATNISRITDHDVSAK